jgi:hypothetical protein
MAWFVALGSFALMFSAGAEVFTAITHMEKLVSAEWELVQSLNRYIQAEEARLDRIRTIGRVVSNISEAANSDIGRYLGHPVNAYRLLRRFLADWQVVEKLVVQPATSQGSQTKVLINQPGFFLFASGSLVGVVRAVMEWNIVSFLGKCKDEANHKSVLSF